MKFFKSKNVSEEQSEEIIRRPRSFLSKVALVIKSLIAAIILCVLVVAIIAWRIPSSRPAIQNIPYVFYNYCKALSSALIDPIQKIEVTGNILTPKEIITNDLGVQVGDSLWRFSAQKAYSRIKDLPLVSSLNIDVDKSTGTIKVAVSERQPIALWQSHGHITLINEKGDVIGLPSDPKKAGIDLKTHLPLVLGEDANTLIGPFLASMSSEKVFLEHVDTYTRIGQRRWNLTLQDKTVLMLPENDPAATLIRFLKTDQKIHLLDKRIPMIDLRIPGQIIIKKIISSQNTH